MLKRLRSSLVAALVAALVATLLVTAIALPLAAQELTVLGGRMTTANLKESSYTWQLDYRHVFHTNFAMSIAYINEGHVIGHHRDGSTMAAWAQLPLANNHLTLSAGVGAYYFFDTQGLPNGDSLNRHGGAPIFSVAATGYLSSRWFYRVLLNRIRPAHDLTVNTGAVGAGFWFGDEKRPTPGHLGTPLAERAYVTGHELNVFAGQSVVNTLFSENALAYAAEYRHGVTRHLDWTLSYIHEGDPEVVRRSGVATQLWAVNTFRDERLTVGVGLGPYVYIDRKHPQTHRGSQVGTPVGTFTLPDNPAAITPLASLTFAVRWSDHWHSRVIWNRVTTAYNRDSDVFLVGCGYRWQ
jgi:hypothetical protein